MKLTPGIKPQLDSSATIVIAILDVILRKINVFIAKKHNNLLLKAFVEVKLTHSFVIN